MLSVFVVYAKMITNFWHPTDWHKICQNRMCNTECHFSIIHCFCSVSVKCHEAYIFWSDNFIWASRRNWFLLVCISIDWWRSFNNPHCKFAITTCLELLITILLNWLMILFHHRPCFISANYISTRGGLVYKLDYIKFDPIRQPCLVSGLYFVVRLQ